jgi:hypothetical protein
MRKLVAHGLMVCCFAVLACTPTKQSNELDLAISLSADKKSVLIKDIPADLLSSIKKDSLQLVAFFALYSVSDDPEMQDLESPIPGNFSEQNEVLVFTPRSQLSKGKTYRAEIYAQNREFSVINLLKKQERLGGNNPITYTFTY